MSGIHERKVDVTGRPHPRRRGARFAVIAAGALATATLLSGCSDQQRRGFLPKGVTQLSPEIQNFWVATWEWALGVGCLVWGLIIYCVIRYRRKKTDTGLPPQLAYHVPIELMCTVIPVIMVAVLFGKTVELDNKMLDTSKKPDVTVNVVGKQWSWDFNYIEAKVYDSGVMAQLDGKRGVEATLPTIYLPVNKRVEFVLTSRDVIHSFWVVQFLQKLDMLPGKVNKFQVVPTQIGTYQGKCAELCGAYHSQMLFQVKVVSQADYQKHINELRSRGNTGMLDNSLMRAGSQLVPGEQQYLPSNMRQADVKTEGSN